MKKQNKQGERPSKQGVRPKPFRLVPKEVYAEAIPCEPKEAPGEKNDER